MITEKQDNIVVGIAIFAFIMIIIQTILCIVGIINSATNTSDYQNNRIYIHDSIYIHDTIYVPTSININDNP